MTATLRLELDDGAVVNALNNAARPYLGLSELDEKEIVETVENWLARTLSE